MNERGLNVCLVRGEWSGVWAGGLGVAGGLEGGHGGDIDWLGEYCEDRRGLTILIESATLLLMDCRAAAGAFGDG